jgi:hypothetical protein
MSLARARDLFNNIKEEIEEELEETEILKILNKLRKLAVWSAI